VLWVFNKGLSAGKKWRILQPALVCLLRFNACKAIRKMYGCLIKRGNWFTQNGRTPADKALDLQLCIFYVILWMYCK